MSRHVRCALLFSVVWLASSVPVSAQVLHAVLCVPTKYAAQSQEVNRQTNLAGERILFLMCRMLENIPPSRLNIVTLTDDDYDRATLLRSIRSLRPEKNDAVFVYCVAHGSFDPTRRFRMTVGNDGGPDNDMRRSELAAEIRNLDIRLGLLITESCAAYRRDASTIDEVERITGKKSRSAQAPAAESIPALIDQLFMKERGYVDFMPASVGEYALFNTNLGPLFTWSLLDVIRTNRQSRLDWDQVFLMSKERMKHFGVRQTPVAVATPRIVKRNKAAMAMAVAGKDRRVHITEVDPGGNAEDAGLRVGDVILAINDQEIETTGQYLLYVDRNSSQPRIKLLIQRGNQTMTVYVEL